MIKIVLKDGTVFEGRKSWRTFWADGFLSSCYILADGKMIRVQISEIKYRIYP